MTEILNTDIFYSFLNKKGNNEIEINSIMSRKKNVDKKTYPFVFRIRPGALHIEDS